MKEFDRRTANSACVGGYCGNGGISRHGGAIWLGISLRPPSRWRRSLFRAMRCLLLNISAACILLFCFYSHVQWNPKIIFITLFWRFALVLLFTKFIGFSHFFSFSFTFKNVNVDKNMRYICNTICKI